MAESEKKGESFHNPSTQKSKSRFTRVTSTQSGEPPSHANHPQKLKFVPNHGADVGTGITMVNELKFQKEEPLIVRVHPLGVHWLVGFSKGRTRIYDSALEKAHEELGTLNPVGIIEGPATPLEKIVVTDIRLFHVNKITGKMNHSTKLVITYASGHIRVSEYRTRNPNVQRIISEIQEVSTLDLNDKFNSVLCTSISYDNDRIVTGGADCKIRVYDRHLVLLVLCHQSDLPESMNGHAMRVLSVIYHPLGRTNPEYEHTFLSAGWDDTVMIWDDRKSQSLWQYHGPHVCSNDALDINESHNLFLCANWSRDKPMYHIYRFNPLVVSERHSENHDLEKEFNTPLASYIHDPHKPSTCMPYVGKWLTQDTLLIAGGNEPLLLIVAKERCEIISSVTVFENSIVSADFRKKSKGHHVCLCEGDAVVSLTLDKTFTKKAKK